MAKSCAWAWFVHASSPSQIPSASRSAGGTSAGQAPLVPVQVSALSHAPAEARVIATAPYCPVAGLAVGERAWSVQAHPELVPDLADHLLAGRIDLIGAERVRTARSSLGRPTDRGIIAQWIAATFGD
mgnify:CR=1 FL=1